MAKRAENFRKNLFLYRIKKNKAVFPIVLIRTLKTEVSHAPGHQTITQTGLEI